MRPGAPHHLDLNVSDLERSAVDALHERLAPLGVQALYGGPRGMGDDDKENYALFVEDPDRVKLEFVARSPKP
jgi:catechol 2,3-dioxygenase-like lactoylglutathione lyase family enzyme